MSVQGRCCIGGSQAKENAILDFEAEKEVFLTLGEQGIAAQCYRYTRDYRIEAFYDGRTLTPEDLRDHHNLRGIAGELYRFHQLKPSNLPATPFFESLFLKWGRMAKDLLENNVDQFPEHERALCDPLRAIYDTQTLQIIKRCVPSGAMFFCHNDTYHGNIMKLVDGQIKLLDFEFSCLNNRAFDFSNLFAETVMKHKQPDYPYFRIAEPEYNDDEIAALIGYYLDHADLRPQERDRQHRQLVRDTKAMIKMSDYMYAMAALPLALNPIQKIRFLPYALQRFQRFLEAAG